MITLMIVGVGVYFGLSVAVALINRFLGGLQARREDARWLGA